MWGLNQEQLDEYYITALANCTDIWEIFIFVYIFKKDPLEITSIFAMKPVL